MPKIGKNHLIKKTKLVKTTTFLTLLVAATFIFSSFAPAAMISNEMNVNDEDEIETLFAAGDSNLGSAPTEDLQMKSPDLEKRYNYDGSYRGLVVWDNGMFFDFGMAAQDEPTFDFHCIDDFMFVADQPVHDVHWIGCYWNGAVVPGAWAVKFYESDFSGMPGDELATYTIEWDDIDKIDLGSQYFEMSVDIDEIIFTGGEKYWIDIYGTQPTFPQTGWGTHLGSWLLTDAHCGSDYFGYPYWTPLSTLFGIETDMAFQLTRKPDHDVAVMDIVSPGDGDELCGCLPVQVEVENLGINDEENVPVSVDIRRTRFTDSFEDPIGVVWGTLSPATCAWTLTTTDTGNPSVVTPRTGSYMAQLNSGQNGRNSDCLLFEMAPENFELFCDPMLSFYMWHDTLGSEDYIEVWVDPGTGVYQFVDGPFYRVCCPGCPVGWTEHTVSLAAFAGLPFVSVAFKGYCDNNKKAYNLHIDDVSKYDLEYYAETTVDLAVGESAVVEFDEEWCPCEWGQFFDDEDDFEILACTHLETDQLPGNDCMSEVITLYFPFEIDVAAIEVTEPVAADPGPYEMCGIIKNVGQTDQSCFKAKMNVHEIGTTVTQIYLQDFDRACSPYYEFPPVGWTIDTHGFGPGNWGANCWWGYTGSASGAPEARFDYYPYADGSWIQLISEPIDCSGYFLLQVEFDHYLNNFGGPYTLSLQASTDLVEWTNIWELVDPTDPYVGPEHISVETTIGANEDLYLAFSFEGNQYNLDYWYVDDLKVSGVGLGDSIWYDEVCVEELAVCEELEVCFEDFTPPLPWPDCDTEKYLVCLSVNPCDPVDQNPDNNLVCDLLEIEYYRDVLIQGLSSPCPAISKGDVIFNQEMTGENNAYTSDSTAGHYVQDDFSGLTDTIGGISWWGCTLFFTGYGWLDGTPDDMQFELKFFEDASGAPGAEVYSEIFDESSYTREYVGTLLGAYSIYKWTAEIAPCVALEPGWLGIQSVGDPDGDWFLWANTINGNSNALQNGGSVADNVAFVLTACESGLPPVDCHIPCGEADLSVEIENAGTHNEIVDVYYELTEYDVETEVGTLVMADTIDNVAIASGATATVDLGTWDFDESTVYGLLVSAPMTGDCDPGNNEDFFGIGVDCCPPVSMHYPDPLYPNGENNWYTSAVDVEITAIDPLCPDPCLGTASGLGEIHYIVNEGDEVVVPGDTAEFSLTEDGVHLVEYWAVDAVGNTEDPFTFEIAIDSTGPTVSLLYNVYQDEAGAWHVDFEAAVGEQTSGANRVEFYIGSSLELTDTSPPFEWAVDWISDYKTATFKAIGFDNAGNDGQDTVAGSTIAQEINAHSHAKTYNKMKTTHSILTSQQPRSR
jgi:hypothetical protein